MRMSSLTMPRPSAFSLSFYHSIFLSFSLHLKGSMESRDRKSRCEFEKKGNVCLRKAVFEASLHTQGEKNDLESSHRDDV